MSRCRRRRQRQRRPRSRLNKQLITYYFGGKQGLYDALRQLWRDREAEFAHPDLPLEELVASYLHAVINDPRMARLLLWEGLTQTADAEPASSTPPEGDEAVADLKRRQARGELATDLDPGFTLLALMGAVLAPIAIPQVARRSTGIDPQDPEFEQRYAEQLKRLIRRLMD